MPDPLLILGASTRAAAGSAIRAGLCPLTADLFCDDDLRQMVGGAKRIGEYPSDLPRIAGGCPPGAWMFTGALENYPKVVAEISAERVLWGISADSIRRLRDPWQLSRCLQKANLLYPEIRRTERPAFAASRPLGRWIRKPYRSAGGGNMQLMPASGPLSSGPDSSGPDSSDANSSDPDSSDADSTGQESARAPRDHNSKYYFQRVVEGESQSAVFVAARGEAILLGVTRQLVGAGWTGATGFRYAGSIGPWQPGAGQLSQWYRIGNCLARAFDLQGLFGVDTIVNELGIWTIEVNPRYSSSIEVLEFGLDLHAVGDHVSACRDGRLRGGSPRPGAGFRGKAVIYAGRAVRIDDAFVEAARQANAGHVWPVIADIPTAGQTIAAGQPVATLFASSDRLTDVEPRLRDVVQAWRTKWKL